MLYGNEALIKGLLSKGLQHNLLLIGPKGVGKGTLARELAKDYLNIKTTVHPDLYILDKEDNTVKIDDIRDLQTFVSYHPSSADKKVFIIDNANHLTAEAQNSLLKVLEDKYNTCIFILVSHATLLPTIESQMQVVRFQPLSDNDMAWYLQQQGVTDVPFYLSISGGSIGKYLNYSNNKDLIECLQSIKNYFCSPSKRKELFYILGQVKEKDSNNFYDKFSEHFESLLCLLESIFHNLYYYMSGIDTKNQLLDYKQLMDHYSVSGVVYILSLLREHRRNYPYSGYSKQDFFSLIMNIVEI